MLKYFNSQALGWGLSRDFIKNRVVTGFFTTFSRQGDGLWTKPAAGSQRRQMALVELAGDNCVLDQKLERNDLEGVFVRGFEDDRARGSGLLDLQPAGS